MEITLVGSGGFGVDEIDARAKAALKKLYERFGKPSMGLYRACFYSKRVVIKFPLSAKGERDNDFESSVSHETYARGREIRIDGFLCVMQERLEEVDWSQHKYEDFPEWVGFIDCGQVGYDRKGRLKAYDFAYNN